MSEFFKSLELTKDYRWAELAVGLFVGYLILRWLTWFIVPVFVPAPEFAVVDGNVMVSEAPGSATTAFVIELINYVISFGGVVIYLVSQGFTWAKGQVATRFDENQITPAAGNFAPVTAADILRNVKQPTLSAHQKEALQVALIKSTEEKDQETLAEIYKMLTNESLCKEVS